MGDLVPFPRPPLKKEHGVPRYDPGAQSLPVLMLECEDPIHVFASAEDGAVCQCGSCRWEAPSNTGVHLLGGADGATIQAG